MADEALVSCVATLSAVFILGGDITRAQNREHLGGLDWRSLRGLEEDKTGPMPSYERVEAGSCLHRMNPSLLLIPSGGKSNLPTAGDSPPIATVMAAELRELGVPSTAIIEETQSFTTQEHFVHCPRDCPRAPLEGDRDRNTRAVLAIWKNYSDDDDDASRRVRVNRSVRPWCYTPHLR